MLLAKTLQSVYGIYLSETYLPGQEVRIAATKHSMKLKSLLLYADPDPANLSEYGSGPRIPVLGTYRNQLWACSHEALPI
jgi:hypothetical protein